MKGLLAGRATLPSVWTLLQLQYDSSAHRGLRWHDIILGNQKRTRSLGFIWQHKSLCGNSEAKMSNICFKVKDLLFLLSSMTVNEICDMIVFGLWIVGRTKDAIWRSLWPLRKLPLQRHILKRPSSAETSRVSEVQVGVVGWVIHGTFLSETSSCPVCEQESQVNKCEWCNLCYKCDVTRLSWRLYKTEQSTISFFLNLPK